MTSFRVRTARMLFGVIIAGAFGLSALAVQARPDRAVVAQIGGGGGNPPCTNPSQIRLQALMPRDFPFVPGAGTDGQDPANCIAWQEFIYLNWRAKPGVVGEPDPKAFPPTFGAPVTSKTETETTVWESYHSAADVFAPPALRGTHARPGHLLLAAIDKFEGHAVRLDGIDQAHGTWLTSRAGQLTFYDVRIDNDEYEYITDPVNNLTSRRAQQRCAQGPVGLILPQGDGGLSGAMPGDHDCLGHHTYYGDHFGALELKAAWLPLPDPKTWPNYLITTADILYPGTKTPVKDVVVGLVGLHIIHKVPGAQQFLWATFEHVDNAPDAKEAAGPPRPWTYYDPASNAAPNVFPHPPCPMPNCVPYSRPVQVLRTDPIPPKSVEATTAFYALLGKNPSVFRNYELVNVQWPSKTVVVPPGALTPLPDGVPVPPNTKPAGKQSELVANTTLETYIQQHSCLHCHVGAPAATSKLKSAGGLPLIDIVTSHSALPKGSAGGYGSDYSFIFNDAARP